MRGGIVEQELIGSESKWEKVVLKVSDKLEAPSHNVVAKMRLLTETEKKIEFSGALLVL